MQLSTVDGSQALKLDLDRLRLLSGSIWGVRTRQACFRIWPITTARRRSVTGYTVDGAKFAGSGRPHW